MAEYIEREAAYREICSDDTMSGYEKAYCSELIRNIPAADVAPVRHGRWDVDGVYVVCSVCNRFTLSPIVKQLPTFIYCPNCGARMDLEEEHDQRRSNSYS